MRVSAFILVILAACVLSGTASGYLISFEAPSWVSAGEPIPVTGTSTFPPGAQGSVIAYRAMPGNMPMSVDYQVFSTGPDGAWAVTFDTDGWMATSYKLEIGKNSNYPLGSASVTYQYVEVIDRSQDCVVTTPATQYWQGNIAISGVAKSHIGGSILVDVFDSAGNDICRTITAPVAADGSFAFSCSVPGPGTYTVRYSDEKGILTTDEVTVIPTPAGIPAPTVTPVPPAGATETPAQSTPAPLAALPGAALGAVYLSAWRRKEGKT